MKTNLTRYVCLLVSLFVLSALPVLAQAPPATTTTSPEPSLPKGMKTVLVEVKHRDPRMLAEVLNGLRSGDRYSQVSPSSEFKTITIRDFPENIATMQDAVKRLDVPEEQPANLEVQVHIIATSQTPVETGGFPTSLEPVIKQLQGTLKFAGYRYVTSITNRLREGGTLETSGSANSANIPGTKASEPTLFQLRTGRVSLRADTDGKTTIYFREVKLGISAPLIFGSGTQYRDFGFNSDLSLREGETVVVGTTNVGETAIIVVVSVKKL
ncbi:MAG: hypothetical protein K1Y36_06855 [Blastocatellia bacterium]|nr:hypothetical protein [Blastocatellia bacterium]